MTLTQTMLHDVATSDFTKRMMEEVEEIKTEVLRAGSKSPEHTMLCILLSNDDKMLAIMATIMVAKYMDVRAEMLLEQVRGED